MLPSEQPRPYEGRPLRIGILAPADLGFAAWERSLFERIAADPSFEIAALVVDGRQAPVKQSTLSKKLLNPRLPERILSGLITRFDQRALGPEQAALTPNFDRELPNIPRIVVHPERRRFVDFFTAEDSALVEKLGLDVLLRHGFGIIKGNILEAAKHGIWSFHHADNRVNRGGPPGFWETLQREPVTGATLQVLTPELDGGRVIARCFRSTKPNAARNQRAIFELSNSLIWRELKRLSREGQVHSKPSELYDGPLYIAPRAIDLMRYCSKRASDVAGGIIHGIKSRRKHRPGMWTLAISQGQIETASLWRTKELSPPADRFWADPFLIEKDGKIFVLFEEFSYEMGRAWISAGVIENGEFAYLGVAIDAGYHMSFPFVFEHDAEICMVPETAVNRRVEIWRATDFPLRWELHRTAMEGTAIADTIIHHHDGQWWLFANICQTEDNDFCNELHVFMIDGPELNEIEPHPENPVVIDSRTARNAGRLYYRNGKLMRPSQNNSYDIYGYGLNVMEVTELTPTRYREKIVCAAEPKFRAGVQALHHVDAVGDTFIIDICKPFGGTK